MTLFARLARMTDADIRDLLAGDHALDAAGELPSADETPAAVLVAIVARADPGLLLTRRTATLRHHAGQIAFPGGRAEPGESPIHTALREAREEIGLPPDLVRIVGTGDPYRTVTGYAVTPVIGIVPPDLPLVAEAGEVADIFEAPLDFVTDPANQRLRHMDWQGRRRSYYEIEWDGRRIWGATAAMIVNLSRRLANAA